MYRTIFMNLGRNFDGMSRDARRQFNVDAHLVVLALKRDAEPGQYQGEPEPSLIDRSGALEDFDAEVVFIDEAFSATTLGREIGSAVVILNGGTTRHSHACVRIFDGLTSGQLVDLQRDGMEVLEEKRER